MGEFLDRYTSLCRQETVAAEVVEFTEMEQIVIDRFKQSFPVAYRQMIDEGIEVLPLAPCMPILLCIYLPTSKRTVLTITEEAGNYVCNGMVIESEDALVRAVGEAVYINVFET